MCVGLGGVVKGRLLERIDQGLASPIDEDFDIDQWFEGEFGKE